MKRIVVGIDAGGSTTKIVGFDISGKENILIEPLFVRATDPVTSIYGAFGKFMDVNALGLSDIARVIITGVGSGFVSKDIFSLKCETIPEFRCTGLGGLYLSNFDKALIASLGTGTAMVYAEKGKEPEYLGGTGVGGGTLIGLSKQILGIETVEHISKLAREGDIHRIDLKISDISKHDIVPGFDDVMTASNFGNISDIANKNDIALGLINMVFETVGMVSVFAARMKNIKNIVLTGNLTAVEQAKDVFESLNRMFGMNFVIPENAQYGTVIGAALAGCRMEREGK